MKSKYLAHLHTVREHLRVNEALASTCSVNLGGHLRGTIGTTDGMRDQRDSNDLCEKMWHVRIEVGDRGDERAVRGGRNSGGGIDVLRDVDVTARLRGGRALDITSCGRALNTERRGDSGMRVHLQREAQAEGDCSSEALGEEHSARLRRKDNKEWLESLRE